MSESGNIRPPRWPERMLEWFCDPALLEDVAGDLYELFHKRAETNVKHARHQFALDVLFLFRPGIIKKFNFSTYQHIMIKNYLLTAYRSAMRYKGHTALNLLSLTIGIASALLIFLWIQDERSVDKFHENDSKLFQVWRNMHQSSGEIRTTPGIPQPLAPTLRDEYPEIDEVALVGWDVDMVFRIGGDEFSVLLPQTSGNQATEIVQRILLKFIEANYGKTTLSIGIVSCQRDPELDLAKDIDRMKDRADKAMYEAKNSGKNCVICKI